MNDRLSPRDILVLKKLGMEGYIEGMSIIKRIPDIPVLANISKPARQRLKWMDYNKEHTIAQTCRYFGIAPKTFHKWKNRYDPMNLLTLEEKSRRPTRVRTWLVSREEESRIKILRKKYIRYGKMKLQTIYQREFGQYISSWKIQRVIEKYQLYYSPVKNAKLRVKRLRYGYKKKITELIKEKRNGFLLALDTIELNVYGQRRYILTGIDTHAKIAFARMYRGHGSSYAADFLKRIYYLLDGRIENIHTDNGSEFAKYFEMAARQLNLPHYFSRPRTPKDNAFDERFNRTLEDEFIALGYLSSDCVYFNTELTEWLVEYNFYRPHQTLGYLTPMEFANKSQVLPMYPSSTNY